MCDFQHYVNALKSWKSDADTGQVALIGVHSWLDWHRLEYARYVPSEVISWMTSSWLVRYALGVNLGCN
ncbi:hypothetical protein F2Q69_00034595 [Brassica cretica]|uniref:Uncharacterized protein n=1 Tax=Brassica cretica TaxID=69181 RepID=A0A8S9SQN8_BRACR|nr:hypothetical protein F2Q69_00034595 [Brassica cretica]